MSIAKRKKKRLKIKAGFIDSWRDETGIYT